MIFFMACTHSTKTNLLHHIMHLDPLPDHPKSSIGCIKINCDGWEGMVWVFCWLVAWTMARSEILPAEFFLQHAAQKPACCITSCTWIPFQTIQNHPLDVSRLILMVGKGWFGSFVGLLPG
jgi:hypothetical protein